MPGNVLAWLSSLHEAVYAARGLPQLWAGYSDAVLKTTTSKCATNPSHSAHRAEAGQALAALVCPPAISAGVTENNVNAAKQGWPLLHKEPTLRHQAQILAAKAKLAPRVRCP